MPAAHATATAREPSSTLALGLLLGGLVVVGVTLGLAAHASYTRAELYFRGAFATAQAEGARRDVEQCLDWVFAEAERCAAQRPMCEAAMTGLTEACLAAQDRTAYCRDLPTAAKGDSHWSFARCQERGFARRHKGCASAYLAVESYCRRDSQGRPLPEPP